MSTSENLPIPIKDIYRDDIKNALSHFEITGIFNRHANIEDARKSVAYVEPDSIVYIEGCRTHAQTGKSLFDYASMLAGHKRTDGKNEVYYQFKESLLTEIRATQMREAFRKKVPDDFSDHSFEELRLLIEKDCDVIVADYQHPSGEDFQDPSQKLSEFIQNNLYDSYDTDLEKIEPNTGVGKHVRRLLISQHDTANAHIAREYFAAMEIGIDAIKIVHTPHSFMNASRHPSGKIRAYVIYGTAHAYSLTHQLEEAGATIEPTIVNELSEHHYFDKSYDDFINNRRRRYALIAFDAAAYFVGVNIRTPQYSEFVSSFYTGLEELNGDRERAVAFAAGCLNILQRAASDPDGAHKELEQLLQPYVDTIADLDSNLSETTF